MHSAFGALNYTLAGLNSDNYFKTGTRLKKNGRDFPNVVAQENLLFYEFLI